MSKSIIIKKNGGPEVLELQDVEVGSPGPEEIKVTNYAIGLNYIDTYHRSGLYPIKLPSGIGLEAAGKVDEIGSNVTEFNKGDNIAYASIPLGAYAQQRIIPAKIAVKVPDEISYQLAATLMTKGLTTNYLLTKTYNLKDFADLSSDELTGAYDIVKGERIKIKGYLEDFALSKKESDDLIMSAREKIYKDWEMRYGKEKIKVNYFWKFKKNNK